MVRDESGKFKVLHDACWAKVKEIIKTNAKKRENIKYIKDNIVNLNKNGSRDYPQPQCRPESIVPVLN